MDGWMESHFGPWVIVYNPLELFVGGIDGVDRAGIGDFNNCKDGGEGSMAEDIDWFGHRRSFIFN